VTDSGTFYYSVVRAVPSATREEAVNLAVVVIAADGSFADLASVSADRVKVLDPLADVRSIELFLDGIRARLPLHGRQLPLPVAGGALGVETLAEWSREFGGQVRVSEPRATLGESPASVLDELYRELVAPLRADPIQRERIVGRSEILRALDAAIPSWQLAPETVIADRTLHGRKAEHLVDRAFFQPDGDRVFAIANAISFQTQLTDVYGARGALIVAVDDLRENAGRRRIHAFALYADAPEERRYLLDESRTLFDAHGITAVSYRDLSPIRPIVGAALAM
jgi:hypothetical protein